MIKHESIIQRARMTKQAKQNKPYVKGIHRTKIHIPPCIQAKAKIL